LRQLTPVLLLALLLPAPARSAAADPSPAALRRALAPIVARPELAAAFWGIAVRSLTTGRTLYALNAAHAFRPASTFKLVTTAAALDAYGPDARLRTSVQSAGRLDATGRILGDLFLVGGGDPDLSARFSPGRPTAAFEEMADALVAAGVRRVEGRLIGYEGLFSDEPRGSGWTWEDLVWGYGAEISALSFNDNGVELQLAPGERPGDVARLDLQPPTPLLSVESDVETGALGTAADVRLDRDAGSNRIRLSGSLPIGGRWSGRVAVEDPARFAATAFAAVLEAKGVQIEGGVTTSRAALPQGLRVLAAHDGPPMAEVIRVVNKESQNLHAEMLLRLVGLKVKGEGSTEKGHAAVAEFLARLGVPTEGWELSDGCGLARTDLVTPDGLAALLAAMARHRYATAFRASLPIAGVDGTLEQRMRGTPAEGRVFAKTGSLNLVNALAGYATTRRGDVAFVVFVNNHAGRGREAVAAIDAVAAALAAAR
jgi:D-alanyl-D-alanine carboxypeptidase/D-alanyl-D-alanine-endopeptidase (penicillin-binding protein 4)